MKIVLDITKLVKDGEITSDQADKLKKFAAKETGSLGINILIAFGVVAICLGIFSFNPSLVFALCLGAVLTVSGVVIKQYHNELWGPLGSANLMIGAIVFTSAFTIFYVEQFGFGLELHLIATVVLLALGVIGKSGLLVTLSALSVAAWLGGSTGYMHASYMLVIREATVTIIVFAALALGALSMSKKLPAAYERIALIYARVSLLLVNFGFWVGSLFGDTPGESWSNTTIFTSPGKFLDFDLTTLPEEAFHIPDTVFSIVWALALIAVGIWGVRQDRRFVVNTAAVFGSILFYTKFFVYFGIINSLAWMFAGIFAIGIALGFWKYNRLAARPSATLS